MDERAQREERRLLHQSLGRSWKSGAGRSGEKVLDRMGWNPFPGARESARGRDAIRQCSRMLLRCVVLLAALASAVYADVVEFEVKAGKNRSVSLPGTADESNFAEPRGYAVHGGRSRAFIERIELNNTGEQPLTGRLLMVNERDWTNLAGFQRTLGLSSDPGRQALTMERLFTFWKDHRSHGGSGLPLANEPFATLNFWGYTL